MHHHRRLLILPLILLAATAAIAENGLDERSPFGIVCPWTDISQTGARWTRCGAGATELVNWPGMEPVKGKIDFTKADNEFNGVDAKEKLFPLPILGYTAPWASRVPGKIDYPPRDLADWENWVHACADHFQGKISFWEVGNEPNIEFFQGSMTDYANLLKTASVAVKRGDPNARVLFGGTAGVDLEFVRHAYEVGCGPYFDVMSVHPYQWDPTFNDGWFIEKLTNMRKLMDSFGDTDKRIWLTELGWATSDKRITPEIQARLLVQTYVTALSLDYLGVDKVFWFAVKDWGGPGYGIYNDDSSKKPAWFAYQTLTGQLAGRPYLGKVAVEGTRCYAFGPSKTEADAVLVIWAPGMDDVTAKLPLPEGDYNVVPISGEGAKVKLSGEAAFTARPAAQYVHVPAAVAQRLAVKTEGRDFPWPGATPTARPLSFATLLPTALANEPGPGNGGASWATERPWLVPERAGIVSLYLHNGQEKEAEAQVRVRIGSVDKTVRARLAAQESRQVDTTITLPADTNLGLAELNVSGKMGEEELAPYSAMVRIAAGPTVEFFANSHIERSVYLQPGAQCGCSESCRFGSEWTYKLGVPRAGSATVTMSVGAHMAHEWGVSWSQDNKTWHTLYEGHSWRDMHTAKITGLERGDLYLRCKGTDEQVGSVEVTFEG